jgi:hypothetical protein
MLDKNNAHPFFNQGNSALITYIYTIATFKQGARAYLIDAMLFVKFKQEVQASEELIM